MTTPESFRDLANSSAGALARSTSRRGRSTRCCIVSSKRACLPVVGSRPIPGGGGIMDTLTTRTEFEPVL